MKIEDNLLLFDHTKELNTKIIRYFFNRLKLFLLVETDIPSPSIIFSANRTIRAKYNEKAANCLGFYDEHTSTIILNAEKYNTKSKIFRYETAPIFNKDLHSGYKYFVPISDIYHELIHHFQFHLGSYQYDSLLEASADILMYVLTGQNNLEYIEETTAIWYIGRKLLKYSLTSFYNFVVFIINNKDDILQQRFSNNKEILKIVVKKYNSDWSLFFKNLHKEYGNEKNLETMKKELSVLHNLIFYKY